MEQTQNFQALNGIKGVFYNKTESEALTDLVLMHQVHGSTACFITDRPTDKPDCDGLITTTPHLKIAVSTADCIPVLMADEKRRIIGGLHVGWKPGLQGMIESALLQFVLHGSRPEDIVVALGPSLQPESFPVSKEMRALYPVSEHRFFTAEEKGIFFNAPAYVKYRLQRASVKNIQEIAINTYRDTSYHSFRREPENKGRQYAVIELL